MADLDRRVELLRGVPVIGSFPENELKTLGDVLEEREIDFFGLVYHRSKADPLYLVDRGIVALMGRYRAVTYREIYEGGYFGSIDSLSIYVSQANVSSRRGADILVLPRNNFGQWLSANPHIPEMLEAKADAWLRDVELSRVQ
jgi:hypothetical protein